jgi:hypothetical protein
MDRFLLKMRYTIILLIIVLVSFSTYAQDRALGLSFYGTIDYSNIPESILIDHRGKITPGVGMQINLKIGQRIDLLSGIAYIDKGYSVRYNPPGDGISRWWYAYFSVPTKIQYNFYRGNRTYYLAGGIENDWNFDGNGHYKFEDFAQSYTLNLGVKQSLNSNWDIKIEPTFRKAIQTYASQNGWQDIPDLNPYSFGIKLLLTKRNKKD